MDRLFELNNHQPSQQNAAGSLVPTQCPVQNSSCPSTQETSSVVISPPQPHPSTSQQTFQEYSEDPSDWMLHSAEKLLEHSRYLNNLLQLNDVSLQPIQKKLLFGKIEWETLHQQYIKLQQNYLSRWNAIKIAHHVIGVTQEKFVEVHDQNRAIAANNEKLVEENKQFKVICDELNQSINECVAMVRGFDKYIAAPQVNSIFSEEPEKLKLKQNTVNEKVNSLSEDKQDLAKQIENLKVENTTLRNDKEELKGDLRQAWVELQQGYEKFEKMRSENKGIVLDLKSKIQKLEEKVKAKDEETEENKRGCGTLFTGQLLTQHLSNFQLQRQLDEVKSLKHERKKVYIPQEKESARRIPHDLKRSPGQSKHEIVNNQQFIEHLPAENVEPRCNLRMCPIQLHNIKYQLQSSQSKSMLKSQAANEEKNTLKSKVELLEKTVKEKEEIILKQGKELETLRSTNEQLDILLEHQCQVEEIATSSDDDDDDLLAESAAKRARKDDDPQAHNRNAD